MIVGTTLRRLDGNPQYSPEIRRGGLGATFVVNLRANGMSGGGKLSVTIEHRNADETSFATLASFTDIDAVGVHTKDATGIKEIVRLRFSFTGTTATDAVVFFVPAPTWRPYA